MVKKKFTTKSLVLRMYIGMTKNTLRKRKPIGNVNKKISMYGNMSEGTFSFRSEYTLKFLKKDT